MKKLGRGLSELGLSELLKHSQQNRAQPQTAEEKLAHLPIDEVFPGQYQPRNHIDPQALEELANSIRAQGVLQPIIVRAQGNKYEIIAGERRWRAAKLAECDKIPAVIRDISDQTAMAAALIENIQRHDLNALEEAQALQRLLEEFHLTHQAVADAVGKSRSAVTNLVRLVNLHPEVKLLMSQGLLEKGHALLLIPLDEIEQTSIAQQIVAAQLSVRETEKLVAQLKNNTGQKPQIGYKMINKNGQEIQIADKLKAKVAIRQNTEGKGKIIIYYHSETELEEILSHIQ